MKKFSRGVALALAACTILPQTAMATSYTVTVSIEDDQVKKTAFTDSYNYVDDSSKLADVMAQFVLNHYNQEDGTGDLRDFGSPAMKAQMDKGLSLYQDESKWGNYVTEMFQEGEDSVSDQKFLDAIKTSATIADLGAGTYSISHKNTVAGDRTQGTTYTVTMTFATKSSGGGGGVTEVEIQEKYKAPENFTQNVMSAPTLNADGKPVIYDVVLENGKVKAVDSSKITGGEVVVLTENVKTGQIAKVKMQPNEGRMVGYVTVLDQYGKKVPLVYDGNGQYSFVMPEGGVVVNSTFRNIPASPKETGVDELLNTDAHFPFMIGDTKGDFRPDDSVNRAEVAMIFYRLLRNQNVATTKTFTDVAEDAWYAEAVEVLASLGIVSGTGNGGYQPERAITRAEFAAICARFATKKIESQEEFSDVSSEHWAYQEIQVANACGWIYGYGDGNYQPDRPITRTEAAAIVNRLLGRIGDQIAMDAGYGEDFPDVQNDGGWAYYEVMEATTGHGEEMEEQCYHETWLETTHEGHNH